jgi:membrane protease YdiL (CAAX protease family)
MENKNIPGTVDVKDNFQEITNRIANKNAMEASLKPYPGFWQAIGLLILNIILYFLVSFVYRFVIEFFQLFDIYQFSNVLLKKSIVDTICAFILLWFGLKKTNRPFKEVFPLNSFNPFWILSLFVFLIGFSVLQSEFKNIWERYIGLMDLGLGESIEELESGSALSFLSVAIVAPFTEEFLFRGLFLKGFIDRYNLNNAVILSSILFAVVHVAPFKLINSFIIGVFLAWLLLNTGSLWPCILTHSIYNGLVYFRNIAVPVFNLKISGYTFGYEYNFHPMWFNIMGLFFFISGGMLIIWTLRQNRYERFGVVNPRHKESDC